jgi:hypothetical protein
MQKNPSGQVKLPQQHHHVGQGILPGGWVVSSIQLFAAIDPEQPEYMVVVGGCASGKPWYAKRSESSVGRHHLEAREGCAY